MKNWFMAQADEYCNPTGKRVCITDSVMETSGEEIVSDVSGEQNSAAEAIAEGEFGLKNGVQAFVVWTE